ncbi:MAG TPA: hypothetical protein VHZ99_02920 [Steroidobacteraceae bacterium]|jgi:hypothetical protein|nr:hypothetical protein [Steroidobacteraceae bacterium]
MASIALISASHFAAAGENTPRYLITTEPNGIDISILKNDKVTPVDGSPFAINPFVPIAQDPLQVAYSASRDRLYALYYTLSGGNMGLASFHLDDGVPTLVSSVGGLPYLFHGVLPPNFIAVGARFILIAQGSELFPYPGLLEVVTNTKDKLSYAGSYTLGYAGPASGSDSLGITTPLSIRTDDDDHYAFITYQNGNPTIQGAWQELSPASGTTTSLVIANSDDDIFSYTITAPGCTQSAHGSLSNDSGNLYGTGIYSQSGSQCATITGAPANFIGALAGIQLNLVTEAADMAPVTNWIRSKSGANGNAAFGECQSIQCVAVYDVSALPSGAPTLIATYGVAENNPLLTPPAR